ncbi:Helix-turn-helix domain-containing protein [Enterococcus malodoratus]|uniref:helix-turn-helix domain-containing protein n=1 Tax=Enterococcus malodoratus TaxID=71451 RepID=UPI0008D47EB7|nr:AraC family transcriptional regulator [Enterococcus malodoratus]SET24428.1 Helix-turn-helix domain-containing protein [Enterococcus malodoratus]
MDVTAVQYASFYQFLKTLDCYLGDDGQMIGEVQHFSENPRREIAAFVTRETTELIEVPSDFIRMLYIMKGSVRVAIDGSESCLSAGGLILTNAATKLSYNGDAEAEVIAFYFKPGYFTESLLGQFFEEPQLYRFFVEALSEEFRGISRYLIYDFAEVTDVHFYTLLLLKQVVKMAYFNNKVTKSAFVLLIVEISQAEPERLIAKDNFVSNGQLTEELLAYIDARLEQVTLEEVARKFHFHPNYLSSLLKEKTGHSFTEIVLLRKIERCKQYLEQTDLTAQAIVERLGYKDKAFFYKRFKQIEGVTPRQYRKMREEEN